MYQIQHPVAFHTVDVAILRFESGKMQVLLIQKHNESSVWRFPGGFIDPKDDSAEAAALREASEETHMKFSGDALYIGSKKIDDPRYRESDHKIITSFYALRWKSGDAGKGFDDVAKTKWFNLNELTPEIKNPIHAPLFEMFEKKFKAEFFATKMVHEAKEFTSNIEKNLNELHDTVSKGVDNMFNTFNNTFNKFFE